MSKTESHIFNVKMELDQKEFDILQQIRNKVNKEGNSWSFEQILTELATINIHNWSKMQFLQSLTPKGQGN